MTQANDKSASKTRGWISNKHVAAFSMVLGSLYEQMLLAFNHSINNIESHDQRPGDESGVTNQVGDAINMVQSAGRSVMHRAQIVGSPSQAEIEQEVQSALLRLGIPSRERVEKIGGELDELNALLDRRLAERHAARAAEEQTALPLPNYGDLTVKEVMAQLDGLGGEALNAMRAYEASHRKRVTLLSEIDRRLARTDRQAVV